MIGSKWAFLVISQLYYGPQRFNQSRRNLSNISIKSLTDILRHLEHYKIVNRQVFPTIPIRGTANKTRKTYAKIKFDQTSRNFRTLRKSGLFLFYSSCDSCLSGRTLSDLQVALYQTCIRPRN
ncbi:helix-turn-helix transcriptional regulator [Paenibacillus sp. P25]|nr:helix-turn-helix transcriptional regulator [Paenibacillus sp. P25]